MSSLEENKAVTHIQEVTKAPQDACRLVWLECNKDVDLACSRLLDSALRARGRGALRDSPPGSASSRSLLRSKGQEAEEEGGAPVAAGRAAVFSLVSVLQLPGGRGQAGG